MPSSLESFWLPCFNNLTRTTMNILCDDVAAIFSIIPEPSLPPWHPVRADEVFEGCFSLYQSTTHRRHPLAACVPERGSDSDPMTFPILPRVELQFACLLALPIDLQSVCHDAASYKVHITFEGWMGKWHMVSATSAFEPRAELFRLGHVKDVDKVEIPRDANGKIGA